MFGIIGPVIALGLFVRRLGWIALGTALGFGVANLSDGWTTSALLSPLAPSPTPVPRPFIAYTFANLRDRQFQPKSIELVEKIEEEEEFTSWLFVTGTAEGKVSGQVNIPTAKPVTVAGANQKFPVIVMLRGYVEKERYQTGVGTKNAAAVFARSGFLTIAPDFLGFGSSDPQPLDDLQARLIRPATVLQLLASLSNLPQADPERVFMWGHSNGGQIALSVLGISGNSIPTTLWAPVSKPFPYSILYYTDDVDDHGKYLRRIIADFENLYDVEEFSMSNYIDWIQAPIQVHQGTADDAVPWKWSSELADSLKKANKDVRLFTYPGADHNLRPSWDTVVRRDIIFFQSFIGS